MKRALITQVMLRRDTADQARQRFDDTSAGVHEDDPLHNATARLEAADALTDATYELVNWLDNLLDQIAKDNGGAAAEDLHWLQLDGDR